MDVICFGQQGWDVCWTGKQQLMTRLTRRGHRVCFVDPEVTVSSTPGSLTSALMSRPRAGALREVEPGLYVLTQHQSAWLPRRVNAKLRLLTLAAVIRRLGMTSSIAMALRPDRLWLMRGVQPSAMVYYAVDEWTGFGGLSEESRRRLRAAEEELLGVVDLALAVSPRLFERFSRFQPNTFLMENGADVEHFAPENIARSPRLPQLARLNRPIMGFIGQIDDRLDQPLLAALACARPQWNFVLSGRVKPGTDLSALASLPNIHLLGYQPYAQLPSMLRDVDICLVPYVTSDLTQSCNPLKVFEYLASGKPVVSRPLEGLLACRSAIALANTPTEFLAKMEAALADPMKGAPQRLAVAAANSWDARVDVLEAHLQSVADGAAHSSAGAAPRQRHCFLNARTAKVSLRLDAKDDSVSMANHRYVPGRFSRRQRVCRKLTRLAGMIYYTSRIAVRIVRHQRPLGVRKILVVHRGYLGDTLLLLPTLQALRARFPGARLVVGVQPEMHAAPLLHTSGNVDGVRTLNFSGGRWRRLGKIVRLFAEGYDLLVTAVWYSMSSEALFSGAPRCVGLYDGHPLQEFLDGLLPLNPNLHEADNNLALVEALGHAPSRPDRVPRLGINPAVAADAGASLLRQLGLPDAARIIILHPGSKRATRRWPADRFAQLAQRLLEDNRDMWIVMTGVTGEVPLIEAIRTSIEGGLRSRAICAAGRTSLEALVGLLDRASVAVCNDTGVMHLARTRDVPLVALLGPENDRRWGPYPLGYAPAVALRVEVPCAPCARGSCESHFCMKATTVDDVYWEVRRLLNRPPRVALPIAPPPTATQPNSPTAKRGGGQPAEELMSIERRITRRSWRELATSGAQLLAVSIVVLPDARANDEQVGAMVAAAAAQSYSPKNLLLVVPLGAAFHEQVPTALEAATGTGLRCQMIHADAPSIARSLSTAVATARGQFVAVVTSTAAWPAARLGIDIATLMRGPRGTGARGALLLNLQRVDKFSDIVDGTWHRAALMDWLWAHGALPATLTEPPVPAAEAYTGSGLVNRGTVRSFLQGVPGRALDLLHSASHRRAADLQDVQGQRI